MARRATGVCSTCGYAPVAFDAPICPRCGVRNPNPGPTNRFVGRGMLIGLGAGAAGGAVCGWFSDLPGMAFGGALLGAIPGLIAGMLVGLVVAMVSALFGGKPRLGGDCPGAGDDPVGDGLPENVFVQFPVRGLGTDDDFELRTRIEQVLDAELRSFGGGRSGGGDMGSDKATVFLVVRDPARALPRLLDALQREGWLTARLLVTEDTGRGYRFWWPDGYPGTFSLV
jgi:hypothetical protein